MDERQKRQYQTVVLAGLLPDIGKFYQRGLEKGSGGHQHLGEECFNQYIAEKLSTIISQDEIGTIRSAINNHHEPGYESFVTPSDCISAGMERIALDKDECGEPSKEVGIIDLMYIQGVHKM